MPAAESSWLGEAAKWQLRGVQRSVCPLVLCRHCQLEIAAGFVRQQSGNCVECNAEWLACAVPLLGLRSPAGTSPSGVLE